MFDFEKDCVIKCYDFRCRCCFDCYFVFIKKTNCFCGDDVGKFKCVWCEKYYRLYMKRQEIILKNKNDINVVTIIND